ncbi:MAG: YncE family protein, partial [Cocleimonas sp.]|nr:YncE family protein [Cocleimonas sp.]
MKQFQFPSLQCKQKTIGFRLLLSSLLVSSALLTACGGSNNNSNNTNDNDNTPQTNEKAPSRSSSIALTSDNRKLVVVNRQNDSVSVIEVRDAHGNDTQTLLAEIPVGKEPRYVVLAPNDNIAYITNTVDGTVSIIDLSLTVPALSGQAISVGSEPRGIAVTPNGKYVYVANHTSGNVSVIRTRD